MKSKLCLLGFSLLAVFFIIFSFADTPLQTDVSDADLGALNAEETQILSELFTYKQQIETSEIKISQISEQLVSIEANIAQKIIEIDKLETEETLQLDRVGAFLKYYQRSGPNSYFEMLFSANSIGDFIWNINVLKDFSKNMDDAISSLETMHAAVLAERESLVSEESKLKTEQEMLKKLVADNQIYVTQLSDRLSALNEEKDRYTELLNAVDAKWQNAQDQIAFLSETIDKLMTNGYISEDLYTLRLTFTGIEITFTDDAVTKIFNQRWPDEKVRLTLTAQDALMTFLEHDMVIRGNFEILDGYLTYVAKSATYDGLPIEYDALTTVFEQYPIEMETKVLFEGADVKIFEQREGLLWFKISTGLF